MLKWIKYLALLLAVLISVIIFVVFKLLLPPQINFPAKADQMIAGITVLNPGSTTLENHTIVVKNGRITEIRPTRTSDDPSICNGCFVVPGLIDAHVHTPPKIAFGNQELFSLLYLKYGVTSIRDVGQSEKSVAALAKKLNAQELVGPRMYSCGPVIDGNPPGWSFSEVAETAEDGIRIVRELAERGVDCIKVYNEIGAEAYGAIVREAAKHNLPVIGHVPHSVGLKGVRNFESQHLTGIPYVNGSRPPYGWDYKNEDVVGMSNADIALAIELAKENNISFTPTLINTRLRLVASDSERFPPTEGMKYLPDFWDMAFRGVAWHPSTEAEISIQLDGVKAAKNIIKRAHAAGLDILAGTDTIMPFVVPGDALLLELDVLSEVLGSPEGALTAATITNGDHIDKDNVGVLRIGAYADMLVLTSDPRIDLKTVRDWEFLMTGGRLISAAQMDKQLARFDKHFHGKAYSAIMGYAMSIKAKDYSKDNVEE